MYDVSTLCVHKHYVTVYFSHEMSMNDASTNEMMEKGVYGGRGSWYFAHSCGLWNDGVGKGKIIPNNEGVVCGKTKLTIAPPLRTL